jgi:hypothetical protein
MNLELVYLAAGVILIILGVVAYVRAVKRGDDIIRWLEATDDALEREIRPWTLPAAKGIQKRNHKSDRWVH